MDVAVVALPTLDGLRQFVLDTLCERDRLDTAMVRLGEAPVRRGRRACGLFFRVRGPRQWQASALWAGDEHRVLFYDCSGARFREVRLSEAPDPTKLPKAA